MNNIIFPKGTALWLKNNTNLTNKQIAQSCNLDILEVSVIQEDNNITQYDPIKFKQFLEEDIKKCESNEHMILKQINNNVNDKQKFIISKYALKQLKDNNQLLFVINYLISTYEDIQYAAIGKILKMSAKTAEVYVGSLKENPINTLVNPVKINLCTKEVLNKIILLEDAKAYHKICKKLSMEQISGVINWLKKTYNKMTLYDIYNILNPITETKINTIIKNYSTTVIINPVENKIFSNRYIQFYTKYII